MLNWSFILQKIKDELGYPFQPIERRDDEIIDYCKRNVLRRFEFYFPDKNRITLNTYDNQAKVPHQLSTYYLFDPQGREIKNVRALYTSMGDLLILGHNPFGAWSYDQVPEVALQNMQARSARVYSPWNYTFEFIPPNMLKIMPNYEGQGSLVVEYERQHDPELSTIPPDLAMTFTDLCQGAVEMWIGKNRMRYAQYETPFGQIQVNGDQVYNEGKELFDKTIEKLENSVYCMNTVFEVG